MRALILCAGLGTRLGLRKTPKCMVKVNGKPVLEHLVNHLNKHGITEIIVNVHKNYDKIFRYFGTRLLYLYEPILLGEVGTERMLQNWLGDEYIVMNGDTLTDIDIRGLMWHKKNRARFMRFGRYAGTTYVNKKYQLKADIECNYYYFDIGTPAKLAHARRFYAKLR